LALQISYGDPMKFGDGVDSISERIRGKAVTYEKYSPPLADATGMDVKAYNTICKSQKDLEDTFDVSAALSFGFGLGSISANAQFVNTHIMTDTSVCFVVKVQVGKLASSLEGTEISKGALSTYQNDPLSFLRRYGDHYISALKTGGIFYGSIYVECHDLNKKKEIEIALKGKANFTVLNASGRGEIKKGISEIIGSLDKRVYVHTVGITFPEIPLTDDVDKMLELASKFPAKTEEHGKMYIVKAMLMDYESLGLPDNNEFLNIKMQRSQFIEKCARIRSEILSKMETINQIRGNPQLYPKQSPTRLSKYQEDLVSLLDILTKRVYLCLNNPQCDMTIEDLKLPRMKGIDEIKTLSVLPSQRIGSPIVAKYDMFKDILGNPTSEEQNSSDGIGKYRLFENGAIFWNPNIGSYEVHGPIFQHYQEEGMESGRLGYPKTDEEKVQAYQRSIFERGGIYLRGNTNETFIGIGTNPISYKYEFTRTKTHRVHLQHVPLPPRFAPVKRMAAAKRSKTKTKIARIRTKNVFPIAKNLNVRMIKLKHPSLLAGPSIADISNPSKRKGASGSATVMTFTKAARRQKGRKRRQ
jgi:LGFP repeat